MDRTSTNSEKLKGVIAQLHQQQQLEKQNLSDGFHELLHRFTVKNLAKETIEKVKTSSTFRERGAATIFGITTALILKGMISRKKQKKNNDYENHPVQKDHLPGIMIGLLRPLLSIAVQSWFEKKAGKKDSNENQLRHDNNKRGRTTNGGFGL